MAAPKVTKVSRAGTRGKKGEEGGGGSGSWTKKNPKGNLRTLDDVQVLAGDD